jgi:hypothetical protein
MTLSINLFTSISSMDLDRQEAIHQYLIYNQIAFQEINLLTAEWPGDVGEEQYFHVMREAMLEADCLLIFADRYAKYKTIVDKELLAAQFLLLPIIVLQPWSCWRIPDELKTKSSHVCAWKSNDLVRVLQKIKKRK